MTLAYDIHSGELLGQVCTVQDLSPYVTSTRFALTADDVENGNRVYLLGRGGRYITARRSSVRLEKAA